jgi:hypothetical protein
MPRKKTEPGLLGEWFRGRKTLERDDLEREEWRYKVTAARLSGEPSVPNVEQLLSTLQVSLAPNRPVKMRRCMVRDSSTLEHSSTNFKHVFGPVPSRRLGRSLGIDLVPYKTCTFDCIYCDLGRTTQKTTSRQSWFPPEQILEEFQTALSALERKPAS